MEHIRAGVTLCGHGIEEVGALPLRSALVIGVLALAAVPSALGARSAAPSTTTAVVSPVGFWAPPQGGVEYRWRVYKTGFEETSMSGFRIGNGCYIFQGDATRRFGREGTGTGLYRVTYRQWKPPAAIPAGWDGRQGCTLSWKADTATVKIVLSGDGQRMTISCDNKPTRICWNFERLLQ